MATIQYPRHRSEAEVQAEIYHAFKNAGYNPRLEVPGSWVNPAGRTIRVRFDVVVFTMDKRPLCVIECKKTVNPSHRQGQLAAYMQFGVPVYMGWENNLTTLVERAKVLAAQPGGESVMDAPGESGTTGSNSHA
jgi:hypothetical protein